MAMKIGNVSCRVLDNWGPAVALTVGSVPSSSDVGSLLNYAIFIGC